MSDSPGGAVRRAAGGFSMVELLFSLAISALLLAGAVSMFVFQQKSFSAQQAGSELDQNLRFGMDRLVGHLRSAGCGIPCSAAQMAPWVTGATNFTTNPQVIRDAAGGSDRVTVAGAFGPADAYLALSAASGSRDLRVRTGQGARFAPAHRRLIVVDRVELARITAVAGDLLTISAAAGATQGLAYAHAVGAPVDLVEVVTYSCGTNAADGVPCLLRDEHDATASAEACVLATGIDHLEVEGSGSVYRVMLAGRSEAPDVRAPAASATNTFLRATLESHVRVRHNGG